MRISIVLFGLALVAFIPSALAMYMTLLAVPKTDEIINPRFYTRSATIALLLLASATARYLGW